MTLHQPPLYKILVGVAALVPALIAHAASSADLVLRNGRIHTVDERQPTAQAVAIRSGRFVAVGTDVQVQRWIGPKTQVVDLGGATAMPGINDVHQHPSTGGWEALYGCNMPPRPDLDFVLKAVADCAKRSEAGDWIVGGSWSSQILDKLTSPQALKALDAASGGHPVVLRDETYHNRWVNSEAMARAGITADSVSPQGGEIVKDPASGRPVGLLKEFPAFRAVETHIPARTIERRTKAAVEALRINNGYGITGVLDAFTSEGDLKLWSAIDRTNPITVWLKAALAFTPSSDSAERYGEALVASRHSSASPRLKPDMAKLFLDGVPPARTALFIEPYVDQPGHPAHDHGKANYTAEQLLAILTKLDKQGIPVKIHAAGDGSVRMVLDAVAEVRRRNGPKGPQHQVAHASFIAERDIARFRTLNVVADISPMLWFPTGLYYATLPVLGEARAAKWWPVKDLLAAGTLVAAGSDWPAGQDTPNPWIGIEGLVTRANPLAEVPGRLWPEQAVDLRTALRIYTLEGARAMGLADKTGSITVGKSADLIVLDRPVLDIPINKVHEVKVLRTYFQGRLVHDNNALRLSTPR